MLSHSTAEAASAAWADGAALHALSSLVQADGKSQPLAHKEITAKGTAAAF